MALDVECVVDGGVNRQGHEVHQACEGEDGTAHSKARTPVPKVSKVMKRTVGALRRRAGILGVGLGHRR